MNKVYLTYGTIISPLGIGVAEHLKCLKSSVSGVNQQAKSGFNNEDLFLGKINELGNNRYDELLTLALDDLLKNSDSEMLKSDSTLFVVSSTKGNLRDLHSDPFASTRRIISEITENKNETIIISNACISGVLAINTASDYLNCSKFEDVIVIGIDALFDFVIYGFQSLYAISDERSQPFDKNRKGISLGEACGIVHLSTTKAESFSVEYLAGFSSNDANHISGPSRTGEGLVRVIERTLNQAQINSHEVDFISAHGTGTVYNDEMESIAFTRTKLNQKPLNSLKGFFGHTLGAAGIIETIVSLLSMEQQILFPSIGFKEQGTSEKLNLIEACESAKIDVVLKTASGFGGGNAALILKNCL